MSDTAPHIAVFLPSLASGGAERLHVQLAPALMERGYRVTFLLQRREGPLLPLVPEGVEIVSLERPGTLSCTLPLARWLKARRPAVLLSNLGHNNIVSLWANRLAGRPTRVVTTFHNTLSQESGKAASLNFRLLPPLCRAFLPWADGIVAVSHGVAEDLSRVTHIPAAKVTTIHNPVVTKDFSRRMEAPAAHPFFSSGAPVILGVGRLTRQKDFATLLDAFAELLRQRDARLLILGEGPLKSELEAQAARLGIGTKAAFAGFVEDPLPYFRAASLYVMSSRYEGFGNALVEALACGTPAISTDCPHGPAEILGNGRYGALTPVGDASAMAEAMLAALAAPLSKEALVARGNHFSVERAAEAYTALFTALVASPAPAG